MIISPLSAGFIEPVSISHASLIASLGSWIPGQKYRITNFRTRNGLPGSNLHGASEYDPLTTYADGDYALYGDDVWESLVNGNIGNTPVEGANWTLTMPYRYTSPTTEVLIVIAATTSTLEPLASSELHPTDIIYYDIDGTSYYSQQATFSHYADRGIIYYREDVQLGLKHGFDFRYCNWIRFHNGSSTYGNDKDYNLISSSDPLSDGTYKLFSTYIGLGSDWICDNTTHNGTSDTSRYAMNDNIVFMGAATGNSIEGNCAGFTGLDEISKLSLGFGSHSTCIEKCIDAKFGRGTHSRLFGDIQDFEAAQYATCNCTDATVVVHHVKISTENTPVYITRNHENECIGYGVAKWSTIKDITGLTTLDLTSGATTEDIVASLVTLTSTNATETIDTYTITDNGYPVKLMPERGLEVTFKNLSTGGDIICNGDLSDYVEIEYRASAWRLKQAVIG